MKNLARKMLSTGLIFAMTAPAFCATQDGTSTATFLRIGQGARAEAMGGAFTAVADDAYAVYWNPAGLAQITRRQLALNHTEFIEDTNSQYASFVLPANKLFGSLGVSATYVDMGKIERRDGTGASVSGDDEVTAYSGTLSWGQALGDRVAIGAGIKYLSQNLAGETGSGIAADLGAILELVPNRLSLGFSALNVGPKIKTGTTDEDIPQTVTGGLAFQVIPETLLVAVDGEKEKGTDTKMHIGAEYVFQGRYMVRGGFQDTKGASGGFSAGLGYLWRPRGEGAKDFFGKVDNKSASAEGLDVRIDYAYVDYGDFESTHRLGLHFAF